MKFKLLFFLFLLSYSSYAQSNKHLEGLAPIIGTWRGTITQTKGVPKVFVFVIQKATFNNDKNKGVLEGYSTVNGGNKTKFSGTWTMTGDNWPSMELNEPLEKDYNGIFALSDCALVNRKKFSFWDGICGTWTSYNKKIQSRIEIVKVSE